MVGKGWRQAGLAERWTHQGSYGQPRDVRVDMVDVKLDGVGDKHEDLLPLIQQDHEAQVANSL